MSKVNAFETAILQHIFQNADITNIGDAGGLLGSSTAGSLYIALFTADPTDTGSVANECDYTGYARKAVARSGSEWTVTDDTVENANAITFDQCTAGSNTVTHFGIMKAGTASVADMIYGGALSASRSVTAGYTPTFAAGDLTVTEG